MALPPTATRYAQAHFGVVTATMLRDAGMSPRSVRRRAENGELTRLHPGIYALSGVPRNWEQSQLAACLATDGLASHRAAQRLWLPALVRDARDWPVEVTVPAHRRLEAKGVIVHRSQDLDQITTSHRSRIPVTDPLRMLGDLCSVAQADELARVVDGLVVSRLLSMAGVGAALTNAAERRVRGVGLLHSVVEQWPVGDTRPDSVLELKFARLCRVAGLPEPVFQHELTLGDQARRVDFAFPDLRVAIEVDGFEVRTDRRVFQDERRRQNDLALDGWIILRFTWHDIINDPDYVVSKIWETLAALGHQAI